MAKPKQYIVAKVARIRIDPNDFKPYEVTLEPKDLYLKIAVDQDTEVDFEMTDGDPATIAEPKILHDIMFEVGKVQLELATDIEVWDIERPR